MSSTAVAHNGCPHGRSSWASCPHCLGINAPRPEKPWDEVTQSILHDPSNEQVFGNCLQACVASVLKLPINAVPHFAQFLWWPMALELWLRGRDLTGKGERTQTVPDRLCIVGGQSSRGVAHVVVGYGGEIVWDPHPSRDGLVSIRDVTWFEPMGEAGANCWFCHVEWGGRSPYADAVSDESDSAPSDATAADQSRPLRPESSQ